MLAKEFQEKYPKIKFDYVSAPLREKDPKGSFRYVVTLSYAGKAHTFDYWKGSGHVGYLVNTGLTKKVEGYSYPLPIFKWKMVTEKQKKDSFDGRIQPIPPQLNEFLYCVAMDAQCIRDYPIWEDFANAMGYNPDSIKDKKVHEACCETYRKLREIFGQAILNELMEVEDE